MSSNLFISVSENGTLVNYVSEGHTIVTHLHPYGYKDMENDGLGVVSASKLKDGIIYVLEFISLHDRIPTEFKLATSKHSSFIKTIIEKESYSQFFTKGFPINVTIENINKKDNSFSYGRHSQTLQKFKV
jgi:hypothetical protein